MVIDQMIISVIMVTAFIYIYIYTIMEISEWAKFAWIWNIKLESSKNLWACGWGLDEALSVNFLVTWLSPCPDTIARSSQFLLPKLVKIHLSASSWWMELSVVLKQGLTTSTGEFRPKSFYSVSISWEGSQKTPQSSATLMARNWIFFSSGDRILRAR